MATYTYKCPNCGAPLQWVPGKEKIGCEYCASDFTAQEVEEYNATLLAEDEAREDRKEDLRQKRVQKEQASAEGAAQEPTAQAAGSAAKEDIGMRSYHCDSCGAEVVTDENTAATFCYYCHSPVILTDRLSGSFKPDEIIPFTLDREAAEEQFLKWAKSRRFVPTSFYSDSQLEKLTGIYLPFWVAAATTKLNIQGTGEISDTWETVDERVTETKVYKIERVGEASYGNMVEMAYRKEDKIDPEQVETIANYELESRKDFALPYLSGFFSETPTVSKKDAQITMESRADAYAQNTIAEATMGYEMVQLSQRDADTSLDELKLVLLPSWIMTYQFNGKTYVYAINGQSGKAFGELPIDNKKLALWSLGIALIVIILMILGGQFIW